MTTKHWKLSVLKNGKPIMLFARTTDEMVEIDLDGEASVSLIRVARQYHRHGQDQDQDHRDLAIGALMSHAVKPTYDCTDTHIRRADTIPDGEPIAHVGGGRGGHLVPIWEEAEEEFE